MALKKQVIGVRKCFVILCSLSLFWIMYWTWSGSALSSHISRTGRKSSVQSIISELLFHRAQPKLVLFWTPWFGSLLINKTWVQAGVQKVMQNCAYQCEFSVNNSLFPVSDAMVYHGWPEGVNVTMYPLPVPLKRRWDQVWVYYMMEPPPPNFKVYSTLNDHYDFNWTMTYRRDSDVWNLYGQFEKIPAGETAMEVKVNHSNGNITKDLVAGMISSCNQGSGRDRYIAELKKYIPVHMYGNCYDLKCATSENCYEKLSKKYKFWLAFENSVCRDYLTEKFFYALSYGMVPVYLGHPDNLRHAPHGSYIHTKDFRNPQALAKYLLYLDKHPEEYAKFFEWKKVYRVREELRDIELKGKHNGKPMSKWCSLCTKLHTFTIEDRKSYRSVRDWFLQNNTASTSSVCLKESFNF